MTTSIGTAQNSTLCSIVPDSHVESTSGYRVEVLDKTFERFPLTPTGLRHATDCAKALSSGESGLESDSDLAYGEDITVVEYYESTKLLLKLPYDKYDCYNLADAADSEVFTRIPYTGTWHFWDVVLDPNHQNAKVISENELILVTQAIETAVRGQITLQLIGDLTTLISCLPDPRITLGQLGSLCIDHKKDKLSAVVLSDRLDLTSEKSYDMVASLTKGFRQGRQRIIDNVLSSKTLIEQIPESALHLLAGDLQAFVSDELIKAIVLQLHQMKQPVTIQSIEIEGTQVD